MSDDFFLTSQEQEVDIPDEETAPDSTEDEDDEEAEFEPEDLDEDKEA